VKRMWPDLGRCYVFVLGGWTEDHPHMARCTGPRYHLEQTQVVHDVTTCDECGAPLPRRGTATVEAPALT